MCTFLRPATCSKAQTAAQQSKCYFFSSGLAKRTAGEVARAGEAFRVSLEDSRRKTAPDAWRVDLQVQYRSQRDRGNTGGESQLGSVSVRPVNTVSAVIFFRRSRFSL